ncbi:recombinase family protein [Streptomyces sp. NPDC052101]|uniref:recombinase family protein n=1 Tax=Streptomyces sp. NPDC052101 TaxID=3155763 RepID=UPI00343A770B
MEPLTEHRLVSGPVVYGFLRLARVSKARQEALTDSLTEYCRSHELQLSGVFSDREVSAGPASAAFTGLLDVLAMPDVYGVVVLAASHLGPKAIAAERGRRIEAAGSRLLLVRPARPTPSSVSRSGPVRCCPGTTRVLDPES